MEIALTRGTFIVPSAHGTLYKLEHILSDKTSLKNLRRLKLYQILFFDQNFMKPKIRRKAGKSQIFGY